MSVSRVQKGGSDRGCRREEVIDGGGWREGLREGAEGRK
jgi:hypothetical protein